MDKVIEHLRKNRDELQQWVIDLCRMPTVSTLPEHKDDLVSAAEWLRELLTSCGLTAEVHQTAGHPAVFAEYYVSDDRPTVLVYGHYDVQPTGDLSLWDAGPFEPQLKDGWLIARGAADDKGQVLMHVAAVAAWLKAEGTLPINVKILIEGEEEIGSPNLAAYIEVHRDRLQCDHVVISDTGMFQDGWPTITYGTRGLLYKEIRLSGPKHDLHSGQFGGTIANPAHVLADLLASLHDDAGRVNIPGFYDRVVEASEEEREQLRNLPFNDQQYLRDLGAPATVGEAGHTTNERRWIRPTLDVNGVYGGFMGSGANTIVPARVGAKISMRLVPEQDGQELSTAFDEAIRARCPDSVKLEIIDHGHADAYLAPLDSPPMRAAAQALKEAFGRDVAFIREGGSLPILPMFRKLLGAESLLLGFASPLCNAHGPNEKLNLADMERGTEALARLLQHWAAAGQE